MKSADYMLVGIISGLLCGGFFFFTIAERNDKNRYANDKNKYTILTDGHTFTNLTKTSQWTYRTESGQIMELYNNKNYTVIKE